MRRLLVPLILLAAWPATAGGYGVESVTRLAYGDGSPLYATDIATAPDGTFIVGAGEALLRVDASHILGRQELPGVGVTAVAADDHGGTYVLDGFAGRLLDVTPDGIVTTLVGGLEEPRAMDRAGGVLVISELNRLTRVDLEGHLLDHPPGHGFMATSIAQDATGTVWHGDAPNPVLLGERPGGGRTVVSFDHGSGSFDSADAPGGLAVAGDDALWVADDDHGFLWRLAPGTRARTLVCGEAGFRLGAPRAIATIGDRVVGLASDSLVVYGPSGTGCDDLPTPRIVSAHVTGRRLHYRLDMPAELTVTLVHNPSAYAPVIARRPVARSGTFTLPRSVHGRKKLGLQANRVGQPLGIRRIIRVRVRRAAPR